MHSRCLWRWQRELSPCDNYGRRLFEELGMDGEAPCSTAWARSAFGIRALTFETPYDSIGDRVLLADDYRSIGAACAEAMVAWVRQQAAVSAPA